VRLQQAAALGKPIIGGEVGMLAGTAPCCLSLGARNADLQAKEQAQIQGGSSGVLALDWVPSTTYTCTYDVVPTDPLMLAGGTLG
jgi:hypothetical protein